jgi:hypothetical protein
MILIEKEFLSFGHQFALRNGLTQKDNHNEDQRAPIFLQWIDTVHQLIYQFPEAFEFNMELLLFIAFHHNSCLYGNFMYNCEYERLEKKASLKTCSIWTDVFNNEKSFLNNNYNPQEFIIPDCSPYKIRFWEEFFFRWNPSIEKKYNYGKLFLIGNNYNNYSININKNDSLRKVGNLSNENNNNYTNTNTNTNTNIENKVFVNSDFENNGINENINIDINTNTNVNYLQRKNEEIKK